jgi:hypothetical protein
VYLAEHKQTKQEMAIKVHTDLDLDAWRYIDRERTDRRRQRDEVHQDGTDRPTDRAIDAS